MLHTIWDALKTRLSSWGIALALGIVSLVSAIAWWLKRRKFEAAHPVPPGTQQIATEHLEEIREDSPTIQRLREEARAERKQKDDQISKEVEDAKQSIRDKFRPQ